LVRALDNLARVGQLKAEPPSRAEFEGLIRSGSARLSDAANERLSVYSRFDLAYNAAHALALRTIASRRWKKIAVRAHVQMKIRSIIATSMCRTTSSAETARADVIGSLPERLSISACCGDCRQVPPGCSVSCGGVLMQPARNSPAEAPLVSHRPVSYAALVLLSAILLGAEPVALAAAPPERSAFGDPWDGLVPRDRSPLTRLQLRPDVQFRAYGRVRLDPVHVALERDWDPTLSQPPPDRRLAPADVLALRRMLAVQLQQRFERQLEYGRYSLASEDAPDVLRLSVSVLDLAADAPEERRSGTDPVYVLDAERIVLTLELRDAVTGQLLARVIDMKQGANAEPWTFEGSPQESPPVAAALDAWAQALRAGLDRVFGRGP
jgi:hypothetical protein